jgi:hypothetical protein
MTPPWQPITAVPTHTRHSQPYHPQANVLSSQTGWQAGASMSMPVSSSQTGPSRLSVQQQAGPSSTSVPLASHSHNQGQRLFNSQSVPSHTGNHGQTSRQFQNGQSFTSASVPARASPISANLANSWNQAGPSSQQPSMSDIDIRRTCEQFIVMLVTEL